jgi:thiol:disulfide interchange protein DsbG
MQAWAVEQDDGTEQFALTTEDGLTIYGKVVGPQGEDISGALLSTLPAGGQKDVVENNAPAGKSAAAEHPQPSQPQQTGAAAAVSEPPAAAPTSEQEPQTTPSQQQTAANPSAPALGSNVSQGPEQAIAQPEAEPRRMASVGSQNVENVPTAQSMDELVAQAKDFTMWFPIGNPKENAPTFYFLADPTCPHCAWAIDGLRSKIESGDIDLRVILTPIRSIEAFNISASILHSENVAQTYLSHEHSITGSGTPVTQSDPSEFDENVLQALRRNVLWMRQNGIKGVPFFIYRTADGPQFAFGNLTDQAIQTAVAIPE